MKKIKGYRTFDIRVNVQSTIYLPDENSFFKMEHTKSGCYGLWNAKLDEIKEQLVQMPTDQIYELLDQRSFAQPIKGGDLFHPLQITDWEEN